MSDPPACDASGENEELMRATHRALRKYGYADLTVKRIAEEYGKSTAAVHYYYDTKDELLTALLDYLLDQFVDEIQEITTTDPERRLELLLDELFVDAEDHRNLLIAIQGMRSQAPYEEAFGEKFRQNDEYLGYVLKAVINHGIDEGVFDDVDAAHVTRALMTIVDGARTRTVVFDDASALTTGRQAASEYVDAMLKGGG